MNAILKSADRYIPLLERIEIIDKYYPLAKEGNFEAYKKLFYAYRDYISTDPKTLSLNCEGCQTKVMLAFKQIVNHWTNG